MTKPSLTAQGGRQVPQSTPNIRQIRSRALAKLRDEARSHQKRQLDEALESLRKNQGPADESAGRQQLLLSIIADSLRSVVTPVIASFGIEPYLSIRAFPDLNIHQWVRVETNYAFISMLINPFALPESDPSPDHLSEILSVLKGLLYHEVGHLLFSVSLNQIVEEDSLPKHPGISTLRRNAAQSRRLSDDDHSILLSWAYGILDDQRMECALASQSPVIGRYLTKTVEHMILDPDADSSARGSLWPFICGRSYLPAAMLISLRREAEDFAADKGLTSELGIIEESVQQFVTATSPIEMREILARITSPLQAWFTGRSSFSRLNYSSHRMRSASESASRLDDVRSEAAQQQIIERIRATGTKNEEIRSGGPTDSTSGGPSSSHCESTPAEQLLDEDELTSDREVEDLIRSFNTGVARNIVRATLLRPMTAVEIRESEIVRNHMLDLVFPLLGHDDPAWQFRQDDGILDPVGYRLKEPGATDFWSQLSGVGSPGPDLAISLILDVSASMKDDIDDLFVAAIGVRKACDHLGLPSTVLIFSDRSQLVFDADDPTEDVIALSQGTTHPQGALEDLANHRHGKRDHLVIAFTDGFWFDTPFLDQYRTPGTVIIGVTNDHGNAKQLRTLGFDEVVYVKSTDLFAQATGSALVPFLA